MDVAMLVSVVVVLIAHLVLAAWVTARAGWGRTRGVDRRPLPLTTLALILMSAIGVLQVVRIAMGR
jgi:hypothetical protein